jgi:hypothetical protein
MLRSRLHHGFAAALAAAALLLSPTCTWASGGTGLGATAALKQHVDNPGQTPMKDGDTTAPAPSGGGVIDPNG